MKTIKIKDYYGVEQVVPVSDEVYEEWLELRREEDRQRKKIAYHHSGATLDDLETGMLSGLENDDPVNDEIIRQGLYSFGAENPVGVVNAQLRRRCIGLDFPTAYCTGTT